MHRLGFQEAQSLLAVGGHQHPIASLLQRHAKNIGKAGLVVGQQDGMGHGGRSLGGDQAMGRLSVKQAPSPGLLCSSTVPPWFSITEKTLASPRPVPWGLVVKNGSKIFS